MPREKRQAPEGKISARQEFKEMRRRRQRNQRLIAGGIILFVIAIFLFAVVPPIYQQITTTPVPVPTLGAIVVSEKPARPLAQDNAMGDPNAPVKIEEFSDYQCVHCKRFSEETEQLIIANYIETGQVYFVSRSMDNFSSDNTRMGKTESRDASEAAYCAGEQNKYWEYRDILFANFIGADQGVYTPNYLEAYAEKLELDMDAFRACVESDKLLPRLKEDRATGEGYGIDGTPSFVINGEVLVGAQPFSEFQAKIEAALAAAKK